VECTSFRIKYTFKRFQPEFFDHFKQKCEYIKYVAKCYCDAIVMRFELLIEMENEEHL
jgi:hypothetical protein